MSLHAFEIGKANGVAVAFVNALDYLDRERGDVRLQLTDGLRASFTCRAQLSGERRALECRMLLDKALENGLKRSPSLQFLATSADKSVTYLSVSFGTFNESIK